MPEYLAPVVYVEESNFRAKRIEGVPTSTTGFVGMTRFGPVQYPGGPKAVQPRLIASFTEFERVYGGLAPLELEGGMVHHPYVAHAARAFFDNGGKRLYVSRVFKPKGTPGAENRGVARLDLPVPDVANKQASWVARWPGSDGGVTIETTVVRSGNIAFVHNESRLGEPRDPSAKGTWGAQARGVHAGALIEVWPAGSMLPGSDAVLDKDKLHVVIVDADGRQLFQGRGGTAPVSLPDDSVLLLVELRVTVQHGDPASRGRRDVYEALALSREQSRYIGNVLDRDSPEDENAAVYLQWADGGGFEPALLALALQAANGARLQDGDDGACAGADDLAGKAADPGSEGDEATGMEALARIDEIAVVAAPDMGALPGDESLSVANRLVRHAEKCRYRIAVLDGPKASSIAGIRRFRGRFDSAYAALYYPWVEILDPLVSPPGAPQWRLLVPPSGFVCGIYARSDIERGVHKAPANEIVHGLTRLEVSINKAQQDVLNAEGVNCLRFFGRSGHRVWGARTVSADPQWRYVNVRRLLIFIEHSIDRGTRWAVFEPNNEQLWAAVRLRVEDFLLLLWRDGALLGARPEQAYFVRCDRSTMTQNDLDNGRVICEIGVAPLRPAEFMIFRIGQWTADAGK